MSRQGQMGTQKERDREGKREEAEKKTPNTANILEILEAIHSYK